ncbi:MAG: glycosyltransferase family 2 protein [Dehalococcoidales bacterium]
MNIQTPLLSLIIPSYTMERLNDILALLTSVSAQSYANMETILIIERSEELYSRINQFLKEKQIYNTLVYFTKERLGPSGARNAGVERARGEIIAFVDDDTVLFPDWAAKVVEVFRGKDIIGVTGQALPLWENGALQWLPTEFYWLVSCTAFLNINEIKPVRCAGGMNMAFKKEAFSYCMFADKFGHQGEIKTKVGPVVDDAEFSINLRLKSAKQIIFDPDIKVWHRVYAYRLNQRFIRGQSYWQGYSKSLLKKAYPHDSDLQGLNREKDLLKRIFLKLIPKTTVLIFKNPQQAFKTLGLTASVLFYVALGFSAHKTPRLTGFTEKYFSP